MLMLGAKTKSNAPPQWPPPAKVVDINCFGKLMPQKTVLFLWQALVSFGERASELANAETTRNNRRRGGGQHNLATKSKCKSKCKCKRDEMRIHIV